MRMSHMDAPARLKLTNGGGMVKGVTAMQSWFVSLIFSGLTSRRTPGVFEEDTLTVLEVLVKSKPQPLVASKAFPQEILDVGGWKIRGEMGGI